MPSLLYARHGEVHIETMGALALEGEGSRKPMAADTICRLTSMTKPIVAACAMTLVEDGTLRLDDPLGPWLPELADLAVLADPNGPLEETVPMRRPITLRDVLTYRLGTGLVTAEPGTVPVDDALAAVDRTRPGDEWIRRLGALPLVRQPGECWVYGTIAVLGLLIAWTAGTSLAEAGPERICGPLGVTDPAFSVDGDRLDRLATAYRSDATGGLVVEDGPEGRWSRPPVFEGGGGGLVSTAQDYLAFASALLSGGVHQGQRVLSRPSETLMTSDHLTPAQKAVSGFGPGYFDDIGWGFGLSVRTRRAHLGPSVGSYGWSGYYSTAWQNDPAEDMTTILLVQRADSPTSLPIFVDFWTAAYQAIDD